MFAVMVQRSISVKSRKVSDEFLTLTDAMFYVADAYEVIDYAIEPEGDFVTFYGYLKHTRFPPDVLTIQAVS